jgi:hypothetical protein
MDGRTLVLAGVLACAAAGCGRPITVQDVNQVVHVCQTDVKTIRNEFGEPSVIGMMGDLVTNTWKGMSGETKMVVAFANDIAVDVVVNPAGLVELKNRCK